MMFFMAKARYAQFIHYKVKSNVYLSINACIIYSTKVKMICGRLACHFRVKNTGEMSIFYT